MADTTILANCTLIDSTGRDPQPEMAIIIEGDVIARVSKADALTAPNGVAVIDCQGLTVMPGLSDAHVHLGIIGTDMTARQ
jgi:imidazolonepropionase-like amidohydrolase